MTLPEFLQSNDIQKNLIKIGHSMKKTYAESDTLIKYIRLPKLVEKQNVLVLSRHAAEAYESCEIKLSELEVAYDEDHGYGIIMPPSFAEEELRW